MIETATFVCSICGESSTDICVYCTKDTCANHRCLRCLRCSDCCECEVPLTAGEPEAASAEPVAEAPPPPPVEAPPVFEPPPELPSAAAAASTDTEPAPSTAEAVEQATTHDELVRALPELFAPEPEPEEQPPAPGEDKKEDGERESAGSDS